MKIKHTEINDAVVSEIGRFAILWNCFEKNYCENNCSINQIVQKSKTLIADDKKITSFLQVLHDRRDLQYDQSIEKYINEGLFPGNARHTKPEFDSHMRNFMEQTNDGCLTGCLLIIYRIRNNLMHGLKDIDDLNDQLELFRTAGDVLESIGCNNVSI